MVVKRHERTRARRTALQVLYSGELTEQSPTMLAETGLYLEENDNSLMNSYALRLLRGTEAHAVEIDQRLTKASDNWAVDRMPIVDRCLLRMAVFEMLYIDEVPLSVSINEAVELAREFGGEDNSSRFVNGVLANLARELDPELAAAADANDTAADDDAAASTESAEEA